MAFTVDNCVGPWPKLKRPAALAVAGARKLRLSVVQSKPIDVEPEPNVMLPFVQLKFATYCD